MPYTPETSGDLSVLTVPAAAAAIGCCRHLIYRAIVDGTLPHIRIGESLRVGAAEISSWLSGLP